MKAELFLNGKLIEIYDHELIQREIKNLLTNYNTYMYGIDRSDESVKYYMVNRKDSSD
jgi:hypothetical protein